MKLILQVRSEGHIYMTYITPPQYEVDFIFCTIVLLYYSVVFKKIKKDNREKHWPDALDVIIRLDSVIY